MALIEVSPDTETRHLYTPKHVSWDAQRSHAHSLVNTGAMVWLHDHAHSETCNVALKSVTPNGGCLLISLTPGTNEHNVVPVSKDNGSPADTNTDS